MGGDVHRRLVARGAGGGEGRGDGTDALAWPRGAPEEVRTLTTEEVLPRIAPHAHTVEHWEHVLRSLFVPYRPPGAGGGPPIRALDPSALVFAGTLADGVAWNARAEGFDTAPMWPRVHFRVEAAGAVFRWKWYAPDPVKWRAEGPACFEPEIVTRLVRRLEEQRLLDFSAPSPLPGGGTWIAHHADRYEHDGVGFDIRVTMPDGRVHALHHALSPPDRARPDAARTAARARLTKWIRRQLS